VFLLQLLYQNKISLGIETKKTRLPQWNLSNLSFP
jgi:hypothetical protein